MPIAKPARATKTASSSKVFSLVPAVAQREMYRTISALKPVVFADASGSEIAEIAVALAIGEKDPLVLCHAARGARAVRKTHVAPKTRSANGRLEAATVSAVAALLGDEKATALVCVGSLEAEDDFRKVFGFAARHKLPILYVVANSLTPGRRGTLDLRTLYAECGIPVFSIEANDAIAAYRVATEALHNARHGRGPCVIEALTVGHERMSKTSSLQLLKGYMERHGNWTL